MPSPRRILTQARSLNHSLAHSSDYLTACRRNFSSGLMAKGRSHRARLQYLSAAVVLACRGAKLDSLRSALEFAQSWGEAKALDEIHNPATVASGPGSLRRWMALWESCCKELAILHGDSLAQENCFLPLLAEPRQRSLKSRRHGDLSLIQLGRGLFGFACPEGGLHLARSLVHVGVFGQGYFLWNWPLMNSQENLTLLPLEPLGVCGCPAFSGDRFGLSWQGQLNSKP